MKKLSRILATVVAIGSFALTTTYAKPSATANGEVVGDVVIGGEVVTDIVANFEEGFKDVSTEVKDELVKLNSGTELAEVLNVEEIINTAKAPLDDLVLLTSFQDLVLRRTDGSVVKDAKNVKLTWEVPNLTEGLGDVYVLHYSTVRNVYEVLKPNAVDFAKKTVTATFPDLSPVAVVYVPSSNQSTDKDDNKVQTGDDTHIALYAVVGVLALGVIAGIVYKSKKHN